MSEREHGLIFGRGDDLGDREPPPYAPTPVVPGYVGEIPFGKPPAEPVTLEGEIPWELRDPDQAAPAEAPTEA